MANAVSSVDVPLSLFSGLVTELSPSDIPEGISPSNSDVVFTPGAVATRPGLNRVFVAPISSLGAVSYQKSYVSPSGTTYNLYFTQGDSILWVENLVTNPGVVTSLWQSAGATYANSVTASGAEYIALSDGLHGVDIPLVYNGQNLYRITQDGPAAPPIVQSVALASVAMADAIAVTPTIATITTVNFVDPYYAATQVTLTAPAAIQLGQLYTVSGNTNSAFNGLPSYTVGSITGGSPGAVTSFLSFDWWWYALETGTGGSATFPAVSLSRANNTVTGTAAAAHGLQVGYLAQIAGQGSTALGGGIATILLNNEDNPGIATVTTNTPHGLQPNNTVFINGVTGTAVGGGISAIARSAQIVTVTTASAHGLQQGSTVLIAGVTDTTYNGQFPVLSAPSDTTFTYYQFDSDGTSSAGTVTYVWPLANTDPALNYFTVQTAPTATSFTISISYTDGTWADGTVTFNWDGKFFVTAILDALTFQYQQYGPNATTTATGTVTPYGQAAPGIHQLQVSFLLADFNITAPSPPVTFVANGGQYLSLSQIPTGPSSVIGRVLQFTGAGGAFFFYIPVPAQVNGLVVSTATQINDNTTTSILLDFSDNTLYAATATSKPGNNFAALNVLGPSAGMFTYASRLIAWGNRNKVDGLLNLGFEGGIVNANEPLGWDLSANVGGILINSRLGWAWETPAGASNNGKISQPIYATASGAPILQAGQFYSLRLFCSVAGFVAKEINASLTSASTGFSSAASLSVVAGSDSFVTLNFPNAIPDSIPQDLTFTIYWTLGTSNIGIIDDLEFFPTFQPYIQNEAWISYAGNPGAFDGDTGILGPEDDTSAIMNFGVVRNSLYIVTGTGLHETSDNKQTEPSNWDVDQIADNCGAFSVASVGRNPQGIGSAGKEWMMWSGPDGAQIFTGQQPVKVSQEIQSLWDSIPSALAFQCWTKNYEAAKLCFFGVPSADGTSMQVLALDYRNLDGEAIASNPPIHISFTGKMIASDLTRKWTIWNIPAFCGELMYRPGNIAPQMVFGCLTPTAGANSYILNPGQFFDDDFGQINASYTTYFFVSHEMEQALQVGSHRKVYTLAAAFITGLGTWTITPLMAALTNPQNTSPAWPLSATQGFDQDFGINVETTRCAFTIQSQPTSGNATWFKLQKLVINMGKAPWAPTRGSMGGTF